MDSPIRDIIDRFSKLSRVTLVHTFRSLKNCSSIDFEIASLYINILLSKFKEKLLISMLAVHTLHIEESATMVLA